MLQIRGWSHVVLSVNELVSLPVVREIEVVLIGELEGVGAGFHGLSISPSDAALARGGIPLARGGLPFQFASFPSRGASLPRELRHSPHEGHHSPREGRRALARGVIPLVRGVTPLPRGRAKFAGGTGPSRAPQPR